MKSKILVVDDAPDVGLLIKQKFIKRVATGELEFFFAANGLEALEKLNEYQDIDLIITDLNMPIMDGITLIKKVSEINPLIKCIVITAYGDIEKIRKAMNSGAFDFLNKPLDLEDLEITVNKALQYVKQIKEKSFLESQLRQSQKMETIGQLASGIAHDFSNVLMLILGRSQIMLYRELDEKTHKDVVEIKKASEKAVSLTNQLLTFSKKHEAKLQTMDLNIVVRDIEFMLKRLIGESFEIDISLTPEIAPVNCEPGQIEQIIINLVINARDAMNDSGNKIFIETSDIVLEDFYPAVYAKIPPGKYTVLSVRDEGIGMTDDLIKNIFEPFFTTKKNNKSTGLGLSTVLNITKNIDAYIVVSSNPEEGSSFKIFFPYIEKELSVSNKSYDYNEITKGDETILIVEDEDGVRGLIREILDMKGYNTLVAHNSTMAKKVCEKYKGKIDLVIADVMLPQTDGLQMIKNLTEISPDIKALYISGYLDEPRVKNDIINSGLYFLPKPFSHYEITKKVREVLNTIK